MATKKQNLYSQENLFLLGTNSKLLLLFCVCVK